MQILINEKLQSLLSLLNKNCIEAYFYGSGLINILLYKNAISSEFDIITTSSYNKLSDILINNEYFINIYENYILAKKNNITFNILSVQNLEYYYKKTALAIDFVLADCNGNVIDKYNILNNIESRIIKCKDNDKICLSYKINKLKAIRLLSELKEFSLDNSAINYIINNPELDGIDKKIIASEINRLLLGDNVKQALTLLQQTSLLKYIFPILNKCAGVSQHEFHTKDVYYHIVDVVGNTPPDLLLRLSALFHDITKPKCKALDNGKIRFYGHDTASAEMSKEILKSYGYEEDLIQKIYIMIKYHMKKKRLSDNELLYMIDECKQADLDVDYIFKLQFADNAATLVTDRSGMYYNQDRAKKLLAN